ncbi:glycosyltransferase family 69 protein [Peniophora sp. CONT]|nr:glycosyltransferase family 69 protein [Peniophora sp. CONT]
MAPPSYLPLHSKSPSLPTLASPSTFTFNRLRIGLLLFLVLSTTLVALYAADCFASIYVALTFTALTPSSAPLSPTRVNPRINLIQQIAYWVSPAARPTCSLESWHNERYASLRNSTNIFLAMNLHDNEEVLPTFFQEMPRLLDFLGPERVFISIYENGSSDRTPRLLRHFDELLNEIGTPHRIITEGTARASDKEDGHRINFLAAVRNLAMEPLYDGSAATTLPDGGPFDDVLWINDVFHCAADVLEVLHQRRVQSATQACALDWGVWGDQVIYDRWVLRPMSGSVLYDYNEISDWFMGDYTREEQLAHLPQLLPDDRDAATRERIQSALPTQVFSCWNGATAFDASVFAPPTDLRFRISHGDFDEQGQLREMSEKASECFLSSVDLWKAGLGKIALVPKASLAYTLEDYEAHRKDAALPAEHDGSLEVIEWIDSPPEKVAMQDYANWWGLERWAPWDEQ